MKWLLPAVRMEFIRSILYIGLVILSLSCTQTKSSKDVKGKETVIENAEELTLWVFPISKYCDNGNMGMDCMQVAFDPPSVPSDWELFYNHIEGFTFEEGTYSVLKVRRSEVIDPPQDASSHRYTLIEILEQQRDIIDLHANPAEEEARLKGIEFRATGNEPFWYLEIDEQDIIKLKLMGDPYPYEFPYIEPVVLGKDQLWTLRDNTVRIDLRITKGFCGDSMSNEERAYRVYMIINKKEYHGCGVKL